ncbi:MAG: DUF1731 domain-containing protein [Actinomycetota bacterium]|nr:DUF1731 domain-containing protein [Actinomycetota bacterium]
MPGPFLLPNMLVRLLAKSAPASIINVSAGGMYPQRTNVDDRQRVVPTRLQQLGYRFSYPELEPALRALVTRS